MVRESVRIGEPERRFHISPQPLSRERVRALHETFNEVSTENPYIVGFSLTGSLSKGSDTSASDIDLHVFYDPGWPVFDDTIQAKAIGSRVKLGVLEKLISQRPVEVNAIMGPIGLGGIDNPNSPFNQAMDVAIRGTADDFRRGLNFVSGFFGLDIGGGLKRYRKDFVASIEALRSEKPEVAEKVWALVLKAIKFTQRGEKGDESYVDFKLPEGLDRLYPNSLDELKKIYG
jgi:hypothetical protein